MNNCVIEMQHIFQITKATICKLNNNKHFIKEYHSAALSWESNAHKLSFCDIIAFFFATNDGNHYKDAIDFALFGKNTIILDKSCNYSYLIPPIEIYKAIIDDYCMQIQIMQKAPNTITYISKILHKIKRRINKQYIKYKLLKIFNRNNKHIAK